MGKKSRSTDKIKERLGLAGLSDGLVSAILFGIVPVFASAHFARKMVCAMGDNVGSGDAKAADRRLAPWMTAEREEFLRERLRNHGCDAPSDMGLRCADFMERLVGGLHHVYGSRSACGVDWTGQCVSVMLAPGPSTYDYSQLTAIVLLAHELSIRAEILVRGRGLGLVLSPRATGDTDITTMHPTMDAVIGRWAEKPWVQELRQYKASKTR